MALSSHAVPVAFFPDSHLLCLSWLLHNVACRAGAGRLLGDALRPRQFRQSRGIWGWRLLCTCCAVDAIFLFFTSSLLTPSPLSAIVFLPPFLSLSLSLPPPLSFTLSGSLALRPTSHRIRKRCATRMLHCARSATSAIRFLCQTRAGHTGYAHPPSARGAAAVHIDSPAAHPPVPRHPTHLAPQAIYIFDNEATIAFAIFMSVVRAAWRGLQRGKTPGQWSLATSFSSSLPAQWASIFLDFWKRSQTERAFDWDMEDLHVRFVVKCVPFNSGVCPHTTAFVLCA